MYNEVFGGIFQLSKHRPYVDLDLLSGTITHLDVVLTTHVILDIFSEVITGYLDQLVASYATQRDHDHLGSPSAYVTYHVTFGSLHIEANTKCSRHRFKDHVYIASAGRVCRVAHSAN